MRVQIVQDHRDQRRLWIVDIDQLAHLLGKIQRRSLRCDIHVAPAPLRLKQQKQIAGAFALVLIIDPSRLPDWAGIGVRTSLTS